MQHTEDEIAEEKTELLKATLRLENVYEEWDGWNEHAFAQKVSCEDFTVEAVTVVPNLLAEHFKKYEGKSVCIVRPEGGFETVHCEPWEVENFVLTQEIAEEISGYINFYNSHNLSGAYFLVLYIND